MLAIVNQVEDTQDITFTDVVSSNKGDASYCGPRIFTLVPSPTKLSISGSKIILASFNPADESTTLVNLTVKLSNYPL